MTTRQIAVSGPAVAIIDDALSAFPEYRAFRRAETSRSAYCAWVGSGAVDPGRIGLTEDQLNLSTRLPVNGRAHVDRILGELHAAGLIDATDYPAEEFDALFTQVSAGFRHHPFTTYIFPEEARLLYALAHLAAPRRTVFPGSYYGYWAVWAMPGIIAAGGTAELIDINPETMDLARRNLEALGLSKGVEYVTGDAIAYGRTLRDVDLCVLDAEGPKDAADPELRDKAIYHPIMRATTPALRPGGLLVAHNMLLENLTDNPYFARRISANEAQYTAFHEHLAEHYDRRAVLPTTEGTGVYRKARRRGGVAGD
ncbi:putative O-methyltransferase YrrM [Kitasatospora sp. MAP12-15]|uniref:O-methyltransferase n=1 Tax=unclassified Kitasatospora TaxID=2633591 RepID=UPI00247506BB|nr:class I SAM-dependent methyltransferase [Kitasatospora sp. MAP12-44]MDH6109375.1 putative O-methyltransferase YrrM [Kitasatospora sp. MAP12-44]